MACIVPFAPLGRRMHSGWQGWCPHNQCREAAVDGHGAVPGARLPL